MSQKMCRICLSTTNLTRLFSNLPGNENFIEILSILTGLEIKSTDGLPQSICIQCKECINKALSLRIKSQQSYQRLLKMGFGQKEKYGVYKAVEVIKCEFDYEDSVFPNSLDGCPVKIEKETNHKLKVKKETKQFKMIRMVIKNNSTETSSKSKQNVTVSKPAKLGNEIFIREKDEEKDSYKVSKEKKRQSYLNLVKGEFDPNGPIQCNICNKTVSKWACFMSHARIHLGIKFVCEHCGKKFVTRGHMLRHCRSQHGMEKILKCPYCPFKAIDATMLKHHTRREHTGERPYICDYCGASYFSRRCLIQHIDSHLTSATVQCEQCSQFFKSRRHLSRHKFSAHTCKLYTYQCPVCKQIYKSAKYVRIHLRKVHSLSVKENKIIKIKL